MGDIASMLIIIVRDIASMLIIIVQCHSIKACLIGLAVILVIISVSIFITAAILSILMKDLLLYLPN